MKAALSTVQKSGTHSSSVITGVIELVASNTLYQYNVTEKLSKLRCWIKAKHFSGSSRPLARPRRGCLRPYSFTNDSVGLRTAAVSNVGAAIVVHVASSGCSRTDAVICN